MVIRSLLLLAAALLVPNTNFAQFAQKQWTLKERQQYMMQCVPTLKQAFSNSQQTTNWTDHSYFYMCSCIGMGLEQAMSYNKAMDMISGKQLNEREAQFSYDIGYQCATIEKQRLGTEKAEELDRYI